MKQTALYNKHLELNAKMVDFAGYQMPLQYSGLTPEHHNVRKALGLFDVSHMGEFILEGEHALALIQKLTSNDASKLFDGKVQYSTLTNTKGGIIDDLLVYRFNATKYMLVVNASNIEKDLSWITAQNDLGVTIKDVSNQTSLLALQGPKAVELMSSIAGFNTAEMPYYTFKEIELQGHSIILSVTGYTGAGGFEIYCANDAAPVLWELLLSKGERFNILPCGLAARDTLRLEMGFCLYGNDIDDTTSPIEAGLGWITKFTKDFTARTIIEQHKTDGVSKKLIGFELEDRGIPRKGYDLVDADGSVIGRVTSGTMSPSLSKAIGMGYVDTQVLKEKQDFYVQIRNKRIKCKGVKFPFYKADV